MGRSAASRSARLVQQLPCAHGAPDSEWTCEPVCHLSVQMGCRALQGLGTDLGPHLPRPSCHLPLL